MPPSTSLALRLSGGTARFAKEASCRFFKERIVCLAINRLAADFQHYGHRKRRNSVQSAMNDLSLDSRKQFSKPSGVDETLGGVVPGGAQQDVVGLMASQHIEDEIGGDGHLPPALLPGDRAAFDQPGDDGAGAKGALHEHRLGKPGVEIIAEHVLIEKPRQTEPARS